jgi:enoyl-CoA hydratase/carnithine racemase
MSKANVELTIDDTLATITLSRPDKLNALTEEMLAALEEAAGELEESRCVRAVLVTGAGDRAFCVGADIEAWSSLEPLEMWRQWIREGHRVFGRVRRLSQPVIAALNGYVFGGGLELALAADLRLATESVELSMPEVTIGMVPGWTGTQRLPALIGPARAKEMLLTGRRVEAAEAERWGLVNKVVPEEQLMDQAQATAEHISQNAPAAVQMSKQLVDGAAGDSVDLTLESLAGALASTTEDVEEGVAAFRENRPAQFSGK